MSKNPFVHCKSRKRRKVRVASQVPKINKEERPYCPRTFVRFNDTSTGYSPLWSCKMCMVCILDEKMVPVHIEHCKAKRAITNTAVLVKKTEASQYVCDVCGRVFSRKVTLKQHSQQHVDESSDLESDSEEISLEQSKKSKKNLSLNDQNMSEDKDKMDVSDNDG